MPPLRRTRRVPLLLFLLAGCGPPVADTSVVDATRDALLSWAEEAHAHHALEGAWPAPPEGPLHHAGVDVRILRVDPSPSGRGAGAGTQPWGLDLAFRADPASGPGPSAPRGEPRVRGVLRLSPPPGEAFVLSWSSGRWLRGRTGEIRIRTLEGAPSGTTAPSGSRAPDAALPGASGVDQKAVSRHDGTGIFAISIPFDASASGSQARHSLATDLLALVP